MHIDTKAINDFTFLRLGTHLEIIALKKEIRREAFLPMLWNYTNMEENKNLIHYIKLFIREALTY